MNVRFYIGLVSISFGATAWGMHTHTPDHEALFAIKYSKPMVAPIHIERNFGSPTPYSHSAPVKSYIPRSPKNTPVSAEEPAKRKNPPSPSRHSAPTVRESELLQRLDEAEKAKVKASLVALQLQKTQDALTQAQSALSDYTTLVEETILSPVNQPEKSDKKS